MGTKRPTHEIKLGRIRAAIWANEAEGQEHWFNVTVSRLYRSDGSWKDGSSFARDDLPIVNKTLDMAYGWILRREQKLELRKKGTNKEE